MRKRFTQTLIATNGLDPDKFQTWVFWPGMLFKSPDKWWGDGGRRDFPHEGLDFCLYQDADGKVCRLGENTRIPVMHDGVVRALFKDYLGQAVILEHVDADHAGGRLMSVYAHTVPEKYIVPAAVVKAGDIIATIADTRHSKAGILPHLHLSFGRPAPDLIYEPFVWNRMRDPEQVKLIDPLPHIRWPHQVLTVGD